MDVTSVNGIAALATSMSETKNSQDISIAVLRKALDSQAATGAALIAAIPQTPNLPPHLGQNINTVA